MPFFKLLFFLYIFQKLYISVMNEMPSYFQMLLTSNFINLLKIKTNPFTTNPFMISMEFLNSIMNSFFE